MNEFSRTERVLGKPALEKLKNASVAVFGIGGVGSFTAEALARGGIGSLSFIDHDTVQLTNINRQLIALHSTLERKKVEVMRERVSNINPRAKVTVYPCFYTTETAEKIPLSSFDYIVDAIDTVSSKLLLAERAQAAGVPLISCMGTGNKLDPTRFEVCDIYKTSVCPLAKVMRRELKKRGIKSLKVVYSKEDPVLLPEYAQAEERPVPGSISFVPSVAGLILAGEVIKGIVYGKDLTSG